MPPNPQFPQLSRFGMASYKDVGFGVPRIVFVPISCLVVTSTLQRRGSAAVSSGSTLVYILNPLIIYNQKSEDPKIRISYEYINLLCQPIMNNMDSHFGASRDSNPKLGREEIFSSKISSAAHEIYASQARISPNGDRSDAALGFWHYQETGASEHRSHVSTGLTANKEADSCSELFNNAGGGARSASLPKMLSSKTGRPRAAVPC